MKEAFQQAKKNVKAPNKELNLQFLLLTQCFLNKCNEYIDLGESINLENIKTVFMETYPSSKKVLMYWGNTTKSKKEQHQLIKNEFSRIVEDYLLDEVLSEHEENMDLSDYVDFLLEIQNELLPLYMLAYVQVLEDRVKSKAPKEIFKIAPSKASDVCPPPESSASNFYSPVSWSGSLKQFDSVQKWQIDTIKNGINQLTLEEDKKVELIRLLIRLKKNGKPFQKADFFGDTPKRFPIGPQNEEKLLSLVAQLGLEIKEIPLKECIENTLDQLFPLIKGPSFEKGSSDLERVDTDNPDAIVAFLKDLWYGFENEDKFKKDLEIFSANCLTKNAVLNKLTNKEFMLNKVIAKWKWAFVIELWEQERILLSKSNGNFIIVDFFRDHKDYDAALSLFKWG